MRPLRIAAAVLVLIGALSASAQCVSEVRDITGRFPPLEAGPIAWNGSVLALAGIQANTGAIWITIANEAGVPLYERFRLPESERSIPYAVLTPGTEFSVWFRDQNRNLLMRRISSTGDFIGNPIYALDDDTFIGDGEAVHIIWSPVLTAYVIAYTVNTPAGRELWLSLVEMNGRERTTSRIATDVGADPYVRVAVSDTSVIALFYKHTSGNVRMARVDRPFYRDLFFDVWGPGTDDLAAIARGTDFMLVRSVRGGGRSAIVSKIISSFGDDIRRESTLVAGSGEDIRLVSLLVRDTELALTYLDAPLGFALQRPRYRLFRFLPTGAPIADVFFAAADVGLRRAATEYDFVWTGSAYVSTTLLELGDNDETYLLRYCPLTPAILGGRTARRGDTVTFTGAASGGVGPYRYEWRYGGGGVVSAPTLTLNFPQTGQYHFELTVYDAAGAQASEFFTVDVVEAPPPSRRRAVRH